MSLRSSDTAVRMGPITVITLIIVIALATLSVLSLITARAAHTAAAKQDDSIQALYENERAAQDFLADLDEALDAHRLAQSTPEQAAEALVAQAFAAGSVSEGGRIETHFDNDARRLRVSLELAEDLSWQVTSWTTESAIDTSEQLSLWQGALAQNTTESQAL